MMADAVSDNFCSLCGLSFFRFGSDNLNTRTSLASPIVQESGLLEKFKIDISPLKKDLVFICFACRNVFVNYNSARANFKRREEQAFNLLLGPIDRNASQIPFVPYLKRKCLLGTNSDKNSDIHHDRPLKIPRFDDEDKIEIKNEFLGFWEEESKMGIKEELKLSSDTDKMKSDDRLIKTTDQLFKPADEKLVNSTDDQLKPSKTKRVRQDAVKFLERGRYRRALVKLWRNSNRFRQNCRSIMSLVIKKETRNLVNHCTVFTKKLGINDIGDISWNPTMNLTSRVAPTTLTLLFALLGVRLQDENRLYVRAGKPNIVGCILAQALYKRFKRRANFIPLLHSLYLHQTGAPPEVRKSLHPLGLTVPSFRLSSVLKEREACNEEPLLNWKRDLEIGFEKAISKAVDTTVTVKNNLPSSPPVTSYGLCYGRIQPSINQKSPLHTPSPSKNNTANQLLAQAYAAQNRVPFSVMPEHNDIRQADNIPFEEFVPDSEDFLLLRGQMEKEIQKILVNYVAFFNGLDVIEDHEYSDEMALKTRIVELGAPFLHPANHGSAATTLKRLGGCMGKLQGEPVPLVLFGGPKAVERAVGAKDVMSCFSDKSDRLDGVEPTATDYSRDILLAKHIMEVFFPNEILKQRWVSEQLRINPTIITQCQEKNIGAIRSFLTMVAHTYTVALGEERLAGVRIGKVGLNSEDKMRMLEKITTDIVTDIWPTIDTASLDTVRQGKECFKDRDCFYEDCVNYKMGSDKACSERCRRPFFLCCQAHLGDELVECSRRENCCRGAWFHINRKCSGLLRAPKDDWICRWCCPRRRTGGVEIAEVGDNWEYHRGLLWYSLLLLVGRTAENQGNGWLQHALWKICMPIFHSYGYSRYLQQGYSFLSGVAGRVPRLAAHDMVHNRTVNLKGGPNSNISWDQAVKLLNKESKRKLWSEGVGKCSTKLMQSWTYSLRQSWERDICQIPEPKPIEHIMIVPDVASHLYISNALRSLPPLPGSNTLTPHLVSVKDPHKLVHKLTQLCNQDAKRQMNEREGEIVELD